MREKVILFLKNHPSIVKIAWDMARLVMTVWGWFVPVREKTMIFCSFGGRSFNDSPKALYDEICKKTDFDGWRLIWAFVNPDSFIIPRGDKVKVDTLAFFKALLYSRVWVSNSGMDRGIETRRKNIIRVETWHGTPLKKICGEENQTGIVKSAETYKGKIDNDTIRCAQSEFDREIFVRIFHASKEAVLLCDLPRNDELLKYSDKDVNTIRERLGIEENIKVILYTPTYREYLINDANDTYIAPPINLGKWKEKLGKDYVLLIRAHYAVTAALSLKDDGFIKDVSGYPSINDLYAVADMMISDYSSTFFDYSILNRPMFCFAYDLKEYEEKRGLYLNINDALPCKVDKDEDSLIDDILNVDLDVAKHKTEIFHKKYAPYAGNACEVIINKILERLN